MKTSIEVELQPFPVPSDVKEVGKVRPRDEGMQGVRAFKLAELDVTVLDSLCDDFRSSVFEKAGKDQPARECVQ